MLGGHCWDSPADCSHLRQFILLRWESTLNEKAKKYSCSAVQCASLLCARPASHMKQVRSAKQMAREATTQWTSALNRWHHQDARKSSVSLWTREPNRKVSRHSYRGSRHRINSQHMSWQFSSSWITFRKEFCTHSSFIWSKCLRANVSVLSESWIQIWIYSLRWSSQAVPLSFCSLLQRVCQYS